MTKRMVHPIDRPLDGVAGKTAEWRTVRPEFIAQHCTKCMSCVIQCPDYCIHLDDDGFPTINQTYCKGCMICVNICPVEALLEVPVLPGGMEDAIDVVALVEEHNEKKRLAKEAKKKK